MQFCINVNKKKYKKINQIICLSSHKTVYQIDGILQAASSAFNYSHVCDRGKLLLDYFEVKV